jgi:mRNA interferase RelE/StbE
MFDVLLLPKAEKFYARADATLARKLAACFSLLEADPTRHPNIKRLVGPLKGFHRFRLGDYRILYRINAAKKTVYVVRIAHRKEAYE